MKTKKRVLVLLLTLPLVLAGCGNNSSTKENQSNKDTNDSSSNTEVVSTIINEEEMFTERDFETEYDKSKSVSVELKGDSISCESDAVNISKTIITLSEEGTYIFSGTLNDGMIVVDAEDSDKLQIVLDNASITSSTSAALYILEADKVFITLENGTDNVLANGGTFTPIDDNNIDGAVFSKQDLTFNGSGSLTVTSPADHGIVCKDDLVFTSGTYTVNSASHGLDANDSVRMTNASMTISSGKDGIHAENTDDTTLGFMYIKDGSLEISAEGDGLSAGNSMQINDGTFNITSGGGSANASKSSSDSWGNFMGGGMGGGRGSRPGGSQTQPQTESESTTDDSSTSIKAVKSIGDMLIKGGTFTIDSADDSIHSNASITVNGGTFTIASGDDAFHADETLTISDGNIDISKSYEGLEALDIKVTGGDIKLVASDDGLNAAGGTDASGYGGVRGNEQFGGGRGGMGGGMGGPGGSSSSNGSIVISGGNLYVNASGDGIDANGSLKISGGYTVVVGPTRGDTATLDYDTSATISGGTFIGTGASGMAQTFSSSDQGVVAVNAGNQSSGTKIELKDSKGNTILTHEPELDFAVVILSSPDVQKGETYTITIGASTSSFEAN